MKFFVLEVFHIRSPCLHSTVLLAQNGFLHLGIPNIYCCTVESGGRDVCHRRSCFSTYPALRSHTHSIFYNLMLKDSSDSSRMHSVTQTAPIQVHNNSPTCMHAVTKRSTYFEAWENMRIIKGYALDGWSK